MGIIKDGQNGGNEKMSTDNDGEMIVRTLRLPPCCTVLPPLQTDESLPFLSNGKGGGEKRDRHINSRVDTGILYLSHSLKVINPSVLSSQET